MECIEFNSKSDLYSEFSNFHEAPFTLYGATWPTVEHCFQAQKFPTDPALQEKIRKAKTPLSAKRLGRTKTDHFRVNWNEVRDTVMLECLQAKFSQNPPLAALLKETGTAQLREKSLSDSYWGTGPNGCGRNRMGALLHQVRKAAL
jgi:ribA/ribD-fused uncharacterized protein